MEMIGDVSSWSDLQVVISDLGNARRVEGSEDEVQNDVKSGFRFSFRSARVCIDFCEIWKKHVCAFLTFLQTVFWNKDPTPLSQRRNHPASTRRFLCFEWRPQGIKSKWIRS